jgi:hypothetical protein
MVTILWPVAFAVAGLLLWVLPTNPKLQELGRITFAVAMFWVIGLSSRTQLHF